MALYRVPCFWEVVGSFLVVAESAEAAADSVENGDFILPTETLYVPGSFEVSRDSVSEEKP